MDVCPPERAGDIDAGTTYETLANVGLATGLVGTAAAIVGLILLASGGDAESRPLQVTGDQLHLRVSF